MAPVLSPELALKIAVHVHRVMRAEQGVETAKVDLGQAFKDAAAAGLPPALVRKVVALMSDTSKLKKPDGRAQAMLDRIRSVTAVDRQPLHSPLGAFSSTDGHSTLLPATNDKGGGHDH